MMHAGLEVSSLPRFLGGTTADSQICRAEVIPPGAAGALQREMDGADAGSVVRGGGAAPGAL